MYVLVQTRDDHLTANRRDESSYPAMSRQQHGPRKQWIEIAGLPSSSYHVLPSSTRQFTTTAGGVLFAANSQSFDWIVLVTETIFISLVRSAKQTKTMQNADVPWSHVCVCFRRNSHFCNWKRNEFFSSFQHMHLSSKRSRIVCDRISEHLISIQ